MKKSYASLTALGAILATITFGAVRMSACNVTPKDLSETYTLPTISIPSTLQQIVNAAPAVIQTLQVARAVQSPVPVLANTTTNVTPTISTVQRIVDDAAPAVAQPVISTIEHILAEATSNSSEAQSKPDVGAPVNSPATVLKGSGESPRWLIGANVQGGVAAMSGHATGYVAAFQWLKHGTANNPKDLKYAILSPAFFASPGVHEVGLLPLSINVATLVPHQPFTNVWVSPYVSVNWGAVNLSNTTFKRVGVVLSATF